MVCCSDTPGLDQISQRLGKREIGLLEHGKPSHQCFGPQISPIHANGRLEKIWGIGAICGLVLQVINGGGCLRDGFYKAAAPDGVWVSL